jgi:hypothetical protein
VGDSPGFDRRRHLEQVISYGTPPVKWCRHLVLRDLVAAAGGDAAEGDAAGSDLAAVGSDAA